MERFKNFIERLKSELKVKTDKEVAEFLGMTPTAFAVRKSRNSVPETELMAAIARNPDISIDECYVFNGVRSYPIEKIEPILGKIKPSMGKLFSPNNKVSNLNGEENLLLQYFRFSDEEGKRTILNTARGMAANKMLMKFDE